jgi:hypothetical protein
LSKDYDGLLENLYDEKEQLVLEMDKIKQDFLQEVILYSKDWFNVEAKALITRKSDLAKNIGVDKLRNLKAEVHTLITNTEALVLDYLDKEEYWWHQQERKDYQSYSYEHRPPEGINEAIRHMCGKLGLIFAQEGFVRLKQTGFTKDYDVWAKNGKPYYPYGSPLSDQVVNLYKEYNNLVAKAQEINAKISQLKKEKEEISVVDLWESL